VPVAALASVESLAVLGSPAALASDEFTAVGTDEATVWVATLAFVDSLAAAAAGLSR